MEKNKIVKKVEEERRKMRKIGRNEGLIIKDGGKSKKLVIVKKRKVRNEI